MWSSLKSDLEELVSVVKEDTNVVLEKVEHERIAKRHSAASKEAERRMSITETFTTPFFGSAEDEDEHELQQIKEFVEGFKIDDKTDEISNLLEEYEELKEQFETLVPEHVQYEEFWERFFYRCDEARIQHEMEVEEEQARQARAELVGSVSHFIGGAAKAVASGVANALTEDDQGKPGSAAGVFRSSGRPPFVMNTAVDEEDDDEEEELGWDDDDDEEDDEEEAYSTSIGVAGSRSTDQSDNLEQIEFKDEALEAIKEQLKQAMLERDQLHETVELQHKEIASLKKSGGGGGDSKQKVIALKKQLTEKENELEKLKQEMESGLLNSTAAADDDDDDNDGASLAAKVKHLTGLLSDKESQLSKMEEALNNSKIELGENVADLQDENKTLRQKLVEISNESAEQVTALEKEVDSSKAKIAALEKELETVKSNLVASETSKTELKTELEGFRAANAKHHAEEDAHSGSKGSAASTAESGVKIDTPAAVSKLSMVGDGSEEEDGWGDEWD